ncbi:HutD family protein [Providencia sneebia]|uniref:HutD family protein n=1 Tax=Providencia sneebia DSM 19967 TaxID=1141660 RepID=K8WC51_9GAMM|nr:HutD family protein [Providencia sneebia]EKT57456.1 hypothetical protein OO7_08715 [Providencia sneebia DSM 19967]
MKIKCFDTTELPVMQWSDGCGSSAEIFCWPVASDYSLRASLANIQQSSVLKRYIEGERLSIALGEAALFIEDPKQTQYSLEKAGDSFLSSANQTVKIELAHGTAQLLNIMFNPERWSVKSEIVSNERRLPVATAGIVLILSGEWDVSGANCRVMKVGQGGWWLPDIGEGVIAPKTAGSKLIWVEITPC